MNIKFMRFTTYSLFGIFAYLRHKDFEKLYNNKNDIDQNQKDIIKYIYKFETRVTIMWLFIMINIILLIQNKLN